MTPEASSRLASVLVALGTGGVLLLAAWLEPSRSGHSTHTQLGLGQCTFLSLTGVPCPMCGATTTFALMADLRPLTALATQPFAALLFAMTLGAFGIAVAEIVAPRRRWTRLLDALAPYESRLAVAFLFVMGLGWIYKIWQMAG